MPPPSHIPPVSPIYGSTKYSNLVNLDLAASALRFPAEQLEDELNSLVKQKVIDSKLLGSHILFAHRLSDVVVNCASAAYTASIQHFERKEDCYKDF